MAAQCFGLDPPTNETLFDRSEIGHYHQIPSAPAKTLRCAEHFAGVGNSPRTVASASSGPAVGFPKTLALAPLINWTLAERTSPNKALLA